MRTLVRLASLIAFAFIAGASASFGQSGLQSTNASGTPWPPVATFSILGYDPNTGEVGGAVQSRVFAVGNGVLWAEANVGVVTTQAVVDVSTDRKG